MYFIQLLAFIILFFMHNSHSLPEGFCRRIDSKQTLRICTEDRIPETKTAYIDTIQAPKFRNTSCECHILPSSHFTFLVFRMMNITQGSRLNFEIKRKVLDKKTSSHEVRIQEITKLKFITQTTRKQEGACLAIYLKNASQEGTFSINCKNVVTTTTTTTTGTMPVSNSSSQMTETMSSLSSISKSHTFSTKKQKSTAQTKVDPENTTDNGSSGIKVPIVAACIAAFICSAGFVILIVIICRRHRSVKEKRNNQSNEVTMSDLDPNTGQSECDTNTYEIPDQNVYEGLDRQDNVSSSEMYQHLYTETKNPDCERDRSVKEKRNNHSNEVTMSDLDPNTGQIECDTNTYEIPDQNVYEGLDRQDNVSSSEMYQHLYTETKNPDCERDRSVKEKRNNQSNEVAVSVLEPNTEQTEYDTNTYEIPDQNVYEGLDRQDNALSDETYQHLYTETQNLDCEIKTQNLSHRQSDTNCLEKEHNNTHDSICDSIHRENSSNEYESYKTNATDHMYETLQKDK